MQIMQFNYPNYAIQLCKLCPLIMQIMQFNYANYAIWLYYLCNSNMQIMQYIFSQEMFQNKKNDFYSKVTYFGHQGWIKLYFYYFQIHFGRFGGFPDWKGNIKQKVKVASCQYTWGAGLRFFIFSQEMLLN